MCIFAETKQQNMATLATLYKKIAKYRLAIDYIEQDGSSAKEIKKKLDNYQKQFDKLYKNKIINQ